MSLRPLITVFGATGAQGGGLARALLDAPDRPFRVRAVTRRPGSRAAQDLAARGAELCAADLDDPDSLGRAMQGAYGAFCVTGYWAHRSPARTLRQAGQLAEAARRAGLRHVIWSTLEDTRRYVEPDGSLMPVLGGRFNVPHFDARGQADPLFVGRGLPLTRLLATLPWDDLMRLGLQPRRAADGRLVLPLPMGRARLPGIAAADIGACAAALFRQGDAAIGRRVGIAAEHLDGDAIAAALSKALGEPVRYRAIGRDAWVRLGLPGGDDEMANLFRFVQLFGGEVCALRDIEATRRLHPGLLRFEDFLARHVSLLPAAPAPTHPA